MKRWVILMLVLMMLSVSPVCQAGSMIRLADDDGVRRAEVWFDGELVIRVIISEVIPVWGDNGSSSDVWLVPCFDGGMLRLTVH